MYIVQCTDVNYTRPMAVNMLEKNKYQQNMIKNCRKFNKNQIKIQVKIE